MERNFSAISFSLDQHPNAQKQGDSERKHVSQQRPSVLRKGNQPFSPGCGFQYWVVDTLWKTEPDINTPCAIPSPSQHLSTDHAPADKSIAQLRMQTSKVQHMEDQLIAERQKLQAMQLHLLDVKSTVDDNNMEKLEHPPRRLQPAEFQYLASLYDHEKVANDALTKVYWQISSSQAMPGVIPSFDYYKRTNLRPPFTYASMIRWAILESPENQRTLKEIYQWFTSMFYYFRHNTSTWKNAVRHNLSLHKCFVRVERRNGSVWTVDEEEFLRRKDQKIQRGLLFL
ncbi:hypothetical protein DNTS_033046 [Danionella cerebrum]|uniref:Fork-head domain-containing protein n=1 Tax=Danionella cerebrum TaxID=2873325 RepID=A0A553NN85_9TELE|nr:hypothetical protein DNTS_033046 [Danionella translucida]